MPVPAARLLSDLCDSFDVSAVYLEFVQRREAEVLAAFESDCADSDSDYSHGQQILFSEFEREFEAGLESAVLSSTGLELATFMGLLSELGEGEEDAEQQQALEVLLAASDFERFVHLTRKELAAREAAQKEAADMGL